MSKLQKTIGRSISCCGVGIHSGEKVTMTLNPAEANHGIIFNRTDVNPRVKIPAICENVKSTLNASTLGVNGTRIGTVEHIMAALAGLSVDNVDIEVDGPEVPILDGSAAPFVELIKQAGVVELDAARSWLVIRRPVRVRVNGSYSEIRPSSNTVFNCSISYPHPMLEYQERSATLTADEFESEIAGARTFGFLEDIDKLRSLGLARGGSLENACVFDENGLVNKEGFRWNDECVRHKILDMVGDLALVGLPFLGEITAHKAGHGLNHKLVHKLLSNPENYDVVDGSEIGENVIEWRESEARAAYL